MKDRGFLRSERNVSTSRLFGDEPLKTKEPSLAVLATQYHFFNCSTISKFGQLPSDLTQEYVDSCPHEPSIASLRFSRKIWNDVLDDNLIVACGKRDWPALSRHILSAGILDRTRFIYRIVIPNLIYIPDQMVLERSKTKKQLPANIPINFFGVTGTDGTWIMMNDEGRYSHVRKPPIWSILQNHWTNVSEQLGDLSPQAAKEWQRAWPIEHRG